jgi:nucleoside-diphosphate-sugar epimerase
VADVAEAVVLAGTLPQAIGQCYNVCDGSAYSLREICLTLAKVVGRPRWLLSLPSGPVLRCCRLAYPFLQRMHLRLARRFDPRVIRFILVNHVIDCRKAQEELGYRPKVLLPEGLERMFAWLARPQPLL